MPGNSHPTVRSRKVAAELRRLRENAAMSGAEVALRLGMSPSKVSRLETGNSGLQVEDVAALLGLYQVCLLYTSPSPRDRTRSRMPSSA